MRAVKRSRGSAALAVEPGCASDSNRAELFRVAAAFIQRRTFRFAANKSELCGARERAEGNAVKRLLIELTAVRRRWRSVFALLLITQFFPLSGCHRAAEPDAKPKILFTQVPERNLADKNKNDVMEGTVSGAKQGQGLILYSKSGGLWWLQPSLTSPFTSILPDGVWRNETHLGSDYGVLLVDPGYHPAAVLDQLPQPEKGVVAVAVSAGQEKSSSYFIDFSGFTWRVRWKPSDRGGASNAYNPENVYVDRKGALHLRIVNRNQQWTCSEINLTQSLGYGTYSFTVEDISKLDPSVVFGIFTWDYSTDQEYHREFDINISRWGERQNKNAEFVLQPTLAPGNFFRFVAPAGKLKHAIVWEPGRLTMVTSRASGRRDTAVVSRRVFTSKVPTPGFESVRLTLFAYTKPNRESAGLQGPTEVVVDRFEYLP
jgi:hypothetical protein